MLASMALAAALAGAPATNPVPPAQRAVSAERGKKVYAAACASCHGPTGEGDGEDAMYYTPPPTSFRSAEHARVPEAEQHQAIAKGLRNMPAFGSKLDEQAIWDLINYLHTLAPAPAPKR